MSNRAYSVLQAVVSEATGAPGSTGRGAYLAGLALNEEIRYQNTRDWWFLISLANFSLATGTRTYTLSTSWPNFRAHISSAMLSADGTRMERHILYLPQVDFFRARFETTPMTGTPSFLTIDTYNDLIRINTAPTVDLNGRTVRTLYHRFIPLLSAAADTLGVVDEAENMIVQGAEWRARRLANVSDWREWKDIAHETERHLLATERSVDVTALGIM